MSLFRPPIVRSASAVLDRSLFTKKFPISAARILDNRKITKLKQELEKSKEILKLERQVNVRSDPDVSLASKGVKCVLLTPEVKPESKHNSG
jgi:tRNA (guanine37-N1)-methyltransferase